MSRGWRINFFHGEDIVERVKQSIVGDVGGGAHGSVRRLVSSLDYLQVKSGWAMYDVFCEAKTLNFDNYCIT